MFSFWQRSNETPNEHLRRAFKIDEADLEANRSSQLTEKQHTKLRQQVVSDVIGFPLGLIIPGIWTIWIAGFEPKAWCMIAFGIGMILFIMLVSLSEAVRLLQDYRNGHVATARGVFRGHTAKGSRGRFILPSKQELCLSYAAFNPFTRGDEYVLYYLPNTKKLIAAEHIPADPI